MVVQHNLTAMNANRYLGINNNKLSKSLEKLSSGYAINRAGDNAAGLAVSEKMRSQIAGMTQGVKNAQDGISMVQTFEGALTETDSILQRMKTLADQMANGSYDDPVDRAAAQQEFLQLNDELDQIADTDFNGVIVLNGGVMADGTKAVNGQFDYTAGVKAPTKLGKDDINLLDGQAFDNKVGTAKNADAFWTSLNPQWDRTDVLTDNDGPESVDVTFKFDKASETWSAISATGGANYKNVTLKDNGNGGFVVTLETPTYKWTDKDNKEQVVMTDTAFYENANDGTVISADDWGKLGAVAQGDYKKITPTAGDPLVSNLANVVVDESKLANGDTITLTFNNPAKGVSAPDNAGAEVADATNFSVAVGAEKAEDIDLSVTKESGLKDSAMTKDINDMIALLDGAGVKVTYDATKNGEVTTDVALKTKMTISLNNGTIINSGDDGTSTEVSVGDTAFTFEWTDDATDGTFMTVKAGTTELFKLTPGTMAGVKGTNADGDETLTYSTGSIEYKVGFENYKYDEGAIPSVEVAKTGSVSKSDAFNKSEAKLTYKDSITLQVGARTKDAVNFTFQYSSTAIGDLKDDLNCTAKGLGTDKLTIADQESANYAIDKIDQAINKVSLVRGTFGAIQNRLEHKIDNMNVSIENLTSAESQIRDTNMPTEMMNFTKQQILAQASQSMLAQANQLPQSVLSLLQ